MKIGIQKNENDCGLYIIKALYEHFYHSKQDVSKLRGETTITDKGVSVYNLVSLAKNNDLLLAPFKAPANEVFLNKNEYFVVGVKNEGFDHYVIVEMKNDYVNVFDPAKGKYKLLYVEFEKIYSNLVLTIKPIKRQVKKQQSRKENIQVINFVFRNFKIILMIFTFTLISLIFSFVLSFFMKIIFDKIIPYQALNLLSLISVAFIGVTIIKVFNGYLKNLFIKKITLALEIHLYDHFVKKLSLASVKKLGSFERSDLLRRMTLIESCSLFLSSSILLVIEEVLTLIIATCLLIYINPQFFAIVLGSGMVMILIAIIFHLFLIPLYKNIFKNAVRHFSYQSSHLNQMYYLKETNYKNFGDEILINSFYDLKTKEYRLYKIISFKNILEGLITGVVPIIITFIFVKQIFKSNISPGNMLLFLSLINFFVSPLYALTDYFLKLKHNLINWDYVKEIIKLKNEPINHNGLELSAIKSLELKSINFKYKKQVLKINKLKLASSIKVIANNGTGKSTLLKLLALRYLPDFPYLINNIDYSFYNLQSIRDKIFYLDQDTFYFAGQILSYITLDNHDLAEGFEANLSKYNLEGFLASNKIRTDHYFKENGINLSSGQKQIIALMRIFTKKYQLIVLDEALENISDENLVFLKKTICDFQDEAIFIEVSHTKRFIKDGKEVQLEAINKIEI